jgi:5-methylcytosine-specific restriction protein A
MDLWAKDPRCARCQRVIAPKEMIRDHIVPLEEGGQDIETNTQVLCLECHQAKTSQESLRGRMRNSIA